ncbi:hypothetical protein [Wolbachia endosymbiont (group A) of Anomoia purmunda]|nr:hypothetical protein [Wolbachia endosymbiont (group A) of Anomoia purmunda]
MGLREMLDPSVKHWDDKKRSTGMTSQGHWNDTLYGLLNCN